MRKHLGYPILELFWGILFLVVVVLSILFGLIGRLGETSRGDLAMTIHEAAKAGDLNLVRQELAAGVAVDAVDNEGYTPLAHAVRSPSASIDLVRTLLDAGADPNNMAGEQKQPLVTLAASTADVEKLQVLLDAGADVNAASEHGYTPILQVMYDLHDSPRLSDVASLLLRTGAEPNCRSTYGETPITTASRFCRFDVVGSVLDHGADPTPLEWTQLMRAICLEDLGAVRTVLMSGPSLLDRDHAHRTPLLLAAAVGDPEKVDLLLASGSHVDERTKWGETALSIAATADDAATVRLLIGHGANVDATDESENSILALAAGQGAAEAVRVLLEGGADASKANEYGETPLTMASSPEVVRLLVAAGEPIANVSAEMRRMLTGLGGGETLECSPKDYFAAKSPCFGRTNPEEMDVPFWREMIRTGVNAYRAKSQFDDPDISNGPVWCYDRFGTSFTELSDGRFVQIGGEHEDFYDPDFCIYNDDVVFDSPGNFRIYGYPEEVFPPTDFHSATYFDGSIYIVGGLGYQGRRRFGYTPVYRLNCTTWRIEPLDTTGDHPGWIYEHRADIDGSSNLLVTDGKVARMAGGEEEHVDNAERYVLDLRTLVWKMR